MFIQRPLTSTVVIVFCALLPSSARADLVSFGVTGSVTIFSGEQNVGWSISVGTPFYGTFTFDPTILDADQGDPTIGQYFNSIVSSNFWLGTDPIVETSRTGTHSWIFVTDNRDGFDTYTVRERSVSFRDHDVNVGLSFDDSTQSVFGSDKLPIVPPDLAAFDAALWHILADNSAFSMLGTITSLTAIPEPTTAFLLLGGSLLILRRNRR